MGGSIDAGPATNSMSSDLKGLSSGFPWRNSSTADGEARRVFRGSLVSFRNGAGCARGVLSGDRKGTYRSWVER